MRIRLNHKEIAGYHIITSPDIRGLHVAAPSLDDVLNELPKAVSYLMSVRGLKHSPVPSAMEFTEVA